MYLHYFHTAHATETWTEPLSTAVAAKKLATYTQVVTGCCKTVVCVCRLKF